MHDLRYSGAQRVVVGEGRCHPLVQLQAVDDDEDMLQVGKELQAPRTQNAGDFQGTRDEINTEDRRRRPAADQM